MLRLLGVRRASAWAAAGAGAYSAGQFLNYVFVAKLCSVEDLGRYAVALAWATPCMLASRMQLRYVLAADARGELSFGLAARARALASALALLALCSAAFTFASPVTAWTLALAACVRAAEDAGDLLLGVAQRANDWPAIARSLALRGLGGAAVLGATLALQPSLLTALSAAFAWQAAVTAFHDWPAVRARALPVARPPWPRVLGVVRAHAALGGAAALVSLNAYVPRYAVERYLGLEAVGVYSALAQLALIGNMAVQAIGQAAVAPLGRAFRSNRRRFVERVTGLLAVAAVGGAAGLILALSVGRLALTWVYREEYAAHADSLVWLAVAAALTYVTAVLGYALVAAGERRAQLRIFSLSGAVALAASLLATPRWGPTGAAAALAAAWAVAAAGAALALRRRLRACRRPEPSRKLSPWPIPNSARPGAAR